MKRFEKWVAVLAVSCLGTTLMVSCKSTPDAATESVADQIEKVTEQESGGEETSADKSAVSESMLQTKASESETLTQSPIMSLEELLALARDRKDKIEQNDLISYNAYSYEIGCSLIETEDDYAAVKKAYEAFGTVLDSAYRTLSREERIKAFNAKKNADSVKAYISRSDEYKQGIAFFKAGDSKYITKDPEGAYNEYISSRLVFTEIYEEISVAREKAMSAIIAAKSKVEQSEQIAESADKSSPLKDEHAEGFVADGEKLLEEDDFSKNDNALVVISVDIDESQGVM